MKTTDHYRRRERGTQIAELAVVIPLLAFLALLVSEGAAIVRAHQIVNNAAREGARLSSLSNKPSAAEVKTAAADYACFNGVKLVGATTSACTAMTFNLTCGTTGSDVVVTQIVVATASGVSENASQVTVTCSYPLSYLPAVSFPWLGLNVPNSIPLRATATFRNLY